MFENLSEKIDKAIHRLSGRSIIIDINVSAAIIDLSAFNYGDII